MRIDVLVNVGPTTLTKRWAPDGTQADVGVVTYAVVDGGGTAVTSGTATKTGSGATTVYTFALPIQTVCDWLTVTWTRTDIGAALVDVVEVVGSQLFTEVQARTKTVSGFQSPLADTSAYTDETIAGWRMQITDLIESKTSHSFVRRYCRVECDGSGGSMLTPSIGERRTAGADRPGGDAYRTPAKLISCTVDGTTVDVSTLKIRRNQIWHPSGWSSSTTPGNVILEYEYGDLTVDPEATENALRLLLANAVPSDLSAYAQTYTNPDGTQSLVNPQGWSYPPKVWEWLTRADRRLLV